MIGTMFGSDYANYPEILFDSFEKMKHEYRKKSVSTTRKNFITRLISQYIHFFGVPEIGMQIRYMHFKKAVDTYFPRKPKGILDAGSGIGSYVLQLHKKYPRAHIIGGDIDGKKIVLSRKIFRGMHIKNVLFRKMDITQKKMGKNRYDIIIAIDVLEHIKMYKKALKNISHALKSGGYVFIHTPHTNQKRIFPFTKGWHHADHVREGFQITTLSRDIEKTGLQTMKAYRTFGPFGRFSWELNHFFLRINFILAGIT